MNVTIFIDDALKTIQRGTVDRKSPFKLPALSTSTDNKVFQRIVVARRFIEHNQSLIIYTDHESKKYHQLKTNPSCSLLFWDPKKRQFCGARRGPHVVPCPEKECCAGGCPGDFPKEPFRIIKRPLRIEGKQFSTEVYVLILLIMFIVAKKTNHSYRSIQSR